MSMLAVVVYFFVHFEFAEAQTAQFNVQQIVKNEYVKNPMIQKLLNGDPKVIFAITALEESGTNCYRAVAELGLKMPNGSVQFSYFGRFLRIYDVSNVKDFPQIDDITKKSLPEGKLWAHYKINAKDMSPAADSQIISSGHVRGLKIYYVVGENQKADVFIPVEGAELMLGFRTLLMNPLAPSMFVIRPDGEVSLAQIMSEESDGDLGFGLRGGGKTGWSPWNHEFIEMVTGVEKGRVDLLENADPILLPPPSDCGVGQPGER